MKQNKRVKSITTKRYFRKKLWLLVDEIISKDVEKRFIKSWNNTVKKFQRGELSWVEMH